MKRLLRGSAVLGGGRLAAAAISAVWLVVAARRLSIGEFGDLAVLLAIGSVMSVVADLGYPFLLSHEVAAAGRVSRSTLRFVVAQRLRVGVLAAFLGSTAYLLVAGDDALVVVALFAISLSSTVVYSSLLAALRGLHVFRVEAANEVVSRLFVLAAGWSALAAGGGLVAAVAVYAAADLGSLLVIGLVARRHIDDDDGIDRARLRLRHHGHLTAGRGLATVYARADTWLVALLSSTRSAALYGAPYRLLDGVLLIPRSIGAVAVPHLAGSEERGSIGAVAALGAALAVLVAVPMALFAEPILVTLFGQEYASAASTLRLLSVSAVPGAVVMTCLPYLGLRRPRPIAWTMGSVLALNVGLNLVLIPAHGPVGAAAANLVTQAILALTLVGLVRTERRARADQVISSMRSSATRAQSAVSGSTTI